MIARMTGRIEEVTTTTVLVDPGVGVWYELLIPTCDSGRLSSRLGQEVVLYTIHFIEGDPSRGGPVTPRLVGFASQSDRDFFRLFTTVKGVGVRKALRALVRPMSEVAAAIENKDAKALTALPEIGKRTAEQIIAELNGKAGEYAGDIQAVEEVDIPAAGSEAIAVLVQLGEKRADAATLVERVLGVAPELDSAEAIIQQVYKLKSGTAGKQ
jgi:Holliday junction DNA helicase RuvA